MFLTVLLVLLGVLLVALTQILYFPTPRTIWMFLKLPTSSGIPILGPVRQLMFLKPAHLRQFCDKHLVNDYKNRLSTVWLLGIPMVALFHPDDLKSLLGSSCFTDKGVEYSSAQQWLGDGLVTSKGKKWTERRKMLTATFHFKILEDNLSNFWVHGKRLVNNLLSSKGETMSAAPFLFKCTLDIICETAMNVKLDPQDKDSAEYVEATRNVTEGLLYRLMNYYLNRDWIWNLTPAGRKFNKNLKIVHGFTDKIIAQRREQISSRYSNAAPPSAESHQKYDKKKQPFLDKLIEMDLNNPGTLTDSDIREEVDTFMFVGHDSTSGTIEFILWELGLNSDYQEKAFQEIYEIFGDGDREVTMEDLVQMQYLEMVIKEGMRLYPAAPYISRHLPQDLILDDSTVLAAGFNIVVTSFYIHRNPTLYEDPERFDPDRFTPEECAKRHPFAYIPFSAGPRNCLGQKYAMMEMKVVLSAILRYCLIQSVTKKEEVSFVPLVILTTHQPILMKIHRRNLPVDNRRLLKSNAT